MIISSEALALLRSCNCAEAGKPLFQLVGLLQRFEVHAAQVGQLATQVGNFLVHRGPLGVGACFVRQLGQLDAIIFAQSLFECRALMGAGRPHQARAFM